MKYACVVHHDEAKLAAMPSADLEALVQECFDWITELEKAGRHVLTAGLQCRRTAVTLRGTPGKVTMTDGPFAETKEILGGFTVFEAKDHTETLAVAARMPPLRVGRVELWPVLDPDGILTDELDQKLATALRNKSRGVDPGLAPRVALVSKAGLGREP